MNDLVELFGGTPLFKCGHQKTPENIKPNGKKIRCRTCANAYEANRRANFTPEQRAKFNAHASRDNRNARITELEAENARLRHHAEAMAGLLVRYHAETPLGHQPHMIAFTTTTTLAAYRKDFPRSD